jgi:hypothetical protein
LDRLKKLGSTGEKLQGNSLVRDPAPRMLSQLLREIAGNPDFLHIFGVATAWCLWKGRTRLPFEVFQTIFLCIFISFHKI